MSVLNEHGMALSGIELESPEITRRTHLDRGILRTRIASIQIWHGQVYTMEETEVVRTSTVDATSVT